jgi:3-phosphoshikimate 1-carboxyvinyltransferase
MTGLESLRIKETDRIAAMQTELAKLNATLEEEKQGQWIMNPGKIPDEIVEISTYDDHRMAMAFAPLALLREVTIEDPDVVAKSYPDFWKDLESVGFSIR